MGIKVAQINAQRSTAVAADLNLIMKRQNIDILCIQEPYTYKGIVRGYKSPEFRTLQPNNVTNIWTAAVVDEAKIEVFQNVYQESGHILCFQVIIGNIKLYIINIYCQFSLPINGFLNNIENIVYNLKGNKILITMDSNAKSETWFSNETDETGKILEEFLIANKLHVINKPSNYPTYSSSRGESNIDLTIVSENMLNDVKNWQVNICSVSDHNLITFEINLERTTSIIGRIDGYQIKKADWDKFSQLCDDKFNEIIIERIRNESPDSALDLFNGVL